MCKILQKFLQVNYLQASFKQNELYASSKFLYKLNFIAILDDDVAEFQEKKFQFSRKYLLNLEYYL